MKQVLLKPHNQETYSRLLDMLEKENRVACVQPTGTGKSYIALKYIEEHPDQKILLLAPTDIILNQFNETVEEIFHENPKESIMKNTTTAKYLDLSLSGFQFVFDEKWDVIIMDEFHRTGASIWNKSIDKLINLNPNTKLIGLSATPIRFLDDYRNMGEEVFHGNYACHYNVNDAWKRGILPIPKYILTDYRITEGTEDYIRQKYPYAKSEEQIKHIVKTYLENGGNIHQILKENLSNKNGKYIVFCSDSAHIRKMRPIVKGWLEPFNSKIHMYTTLSMDDEPDAELLAFKNDASESLRLLFCVERLNEGFHLSDLDGEFMLRPTLSPIIYLQQMGRVLNAGSTKQPVIFDLVNNFSEYRRTVLRYRDMPEEEIEKLSPKERGEYNSYKEGKYDEFLEFDFVQKISQICDLFDEIDINVCDYRWNEIYELVKEYYKRFNKWPNYKTTYKSHNLGIWLNNQKWKYKNGKLSKERQEMLKEIGFKVDVNIHDKLWNKMYELLKEYHFETNQWPKQKTTYKAKELGNWLSTQKQAYKYGKLSKERQELLEEIGFDINENTFDKAWIEMYELLKEYHFETNQWPNTVTLYKDKKIGHWFSDQKQAYKKGNLSKERQELFKEIGVDIHENTYDKSWNKMYELVKEYYKRFNKWPKSKAIYKGQNVGNWLSYQKQIYKKGELSIERQNLLSEIGFEVNENIHDKLWNEMYELLKEYHSETNQWPKSKAIYKGQNVGNWLSSQKRAYKNGKLSKERQELLEEIGFKVDENIHDKLWNKMYELLKEYHSETNQWPKSKVICKGQNIGIWLNYQKWNYINSKLSIVRQEKLESIGVVFDNNKKDQKN